MAFKKIETTRKSTYAAKQLLSAIREGTYKIGDQIPPERELAERMGISRPLIREALSALQVAGIIESRAGDGTYVRNLIGSGNLKKQVLSILEDNEKPIDVIEAREILEEGIVKLAADRASADNIEEIEKVLVEEREAAEEINYARYVRADRNFHLAIASASHNPLLKVVVAPLIQIMGQSLWGGIDQLYLFNEPYIKQTLDEHSQIFDGIRQGRMKVAAKAMRKHLENSKQRFLGNKINGAP